MASNETYRVRPVDASHNGRDGRRLVVTDTRVGDIGPEEDAGAVPDAGEVADMVESLVEAEVATPTLDIHLQQQIGGCRLVEALVIQVACTTHALTHSLS